VKNSGKKSTLPVTRDAAGQFRDCPGESGTVGNPVHVSADVRTGRHAVTQLSRELRTQVSNTYTYKSASLIYTIINNQYHFVTCSDRFPVPIRSAVKSNLSNWCCRNLSKCALNAGTVKCCSGFRQFIEPGPLTQCPQGKALAALKKKLDY